MMNLKYYTRRALLAVVIIWAFDLVVTIAGLWWLIGELE